MKDRIKQLRKALKMTQPQFADQLHLATNYIYLVESGKSPVTDKLIFNIVNVFNVNEEWIRSGSGEMLRPLSREEEVAEIADQMLDEIQPSLKTELIKLVAQMPQEDLETFYDYAKKFVKAMEEAEKNLPQ